MKIYIISLVCIGMSINSFSQQSVFPTNGQNVGVGTVKPSIHSGYTGISTNGKLGGFIDFSTGNVEQGFIYGDAKSGLNLWSSSTSTGIHFYPKGSERVTILGSGYFGIGTTKPKTRLEVAHPAGNVSTAIFHSNGKQACGNVLTLATDAVGDDPKLLFSYENNTKTWAIGGYQTSTRFSIWEGASDQISPLYSLQGGFGTERLTVLSGGNVGIGTSTPANKLDVNGTIHSKAVVVDLNGWPDYVFKTKYHLSSINELATYIKENHHLPGLPAAADVQSKGLDLGEINKKLTQKVEELTLYLIDKDKQLKDQNTTIQSQQEQLNKMQSEISAIEKKLNK